MLFSQKCVYDTSVQFQFSFQLAGTMFSFSSIHVYSQKLDGYFEVRSVLGTRGHAYKLFKPRCTASIRSNFFAERVINIWSSLLVQNRSSRFCSAVHENYFPINFIVLPFGVINIDLVVIC